MTCFRLPNGTTVCQWCVKNNVSYQSVWEWMNRGFTPQEACKIALAHKGKKNCNAKHFYNGRSVADILGGSHTKAYKRVMGRVERGDSIKDSVEMELK